MRTLKRLTALAKHQRHALKWVLPFCHIDGIVYMCRLHYLHPLTCVTAVLNTLAKKWYSWRTESGLWQKSSWLSHVRTLHGKKYVTTDSLTCVPKRWRMQIPHTASHPSFKLCITWEYAWQDAYTYKKYPMLSSQRFCQIFITCSWGKEERKVTMIFMHQRWVFSLLCFVNWQENTHNQQNATKNKQCFNNSSSLFQLNNKVDRQKWDKNE